MAAGFGVLKFFDRIILELNDLATTNADQMIVMIAALSALIQFFSVAKILLLKNTAFF